MSDQPSDSEAIVEVAPTFRVIEKSQVFSAPRSRLLLSPEECAEIVSYWEDEKSEEGQYGGREQLPDYRIGKIQWLHAWESPKYLKLFTRLYAVIRDANARHYGVDVDGMIDSLQLTRYTPGDHYDWHMDCGSAETRHRKLSFSLQLSSLDDYEGGTLEFFASKNVNGVYQQGTLTVFPSFLMHRVTPVTQGTRWALVGWVSGGAWR